MATAEASKVANTAITIGSKLKSGESITPEIIAAAGSIAATTGAIMAMNNRGNPPPAFLLAFYSLATTNVPAAATHFRKGEIKKGVFAGLNGAWSLTCLTAVVRGLGLLAPQLESTLTAAQYASLTMAILNTLGLGYEPSKALVKGTYYLMQKQLGTKEPDVESATSSEEEGARTSDFDENDPLIGLPINAPQDGAEPDSTPPNLGMN
ncbi:MAG: hypothetical protein KAS93_01685 [Gammaproteobacteria bacterium]|nr:hypothetical protein [Gammaproteobacteria bacterium]